MAATAVGATAELCPTKEVLQSCHRLQYVNASRFDGFSQEVLAAIDRTAQQICIEVAIYREACEDRSPPKVGDTLEVHHALDDAVQGGAAPATPQGEKPPQSEVLRASRPRRKARMSRASAMPVVGESRGRANSGPWAVTSAEEPLEPTIFMRGKSFVSLVLGEPHTPPAQAAIKRQMLATAPSMLHTLSDARRADDSSLRHVVDGREARQLLGWFTAHRPPR